MNSLFVWQIQTCHKPGLSLVGQSYCPMLVAFLEGLSPDLRLKTGLTKVSELCRICKSFLMTWRMKSADGND